MNIFFLDRDPQTCARFHCDQHVSKMCIEYAQLLSTAHRVAGSMWADDVYKIAHLNHPSTIWTRSSHDHYSWLFELWRELNNEFARRRGKVHASWRKLGHILCYHPDLGCYGWDDPPQCMPEEFKRYDAVDAYRAYYIGDKARFATWKWKNSVMPDWWDYEEYNEDDQSLMVIAEGQD
jgi:hypothetical protein